MGSTNNMSIMMMLVFCFVVLVFGGILTLIWYGVFPNSCEELKRIYPSPIRHVGWVRGSIGLLSFVRSLSLDIHSDKLIIIYFGRGLCVDYCSYSFNEHDLLFSNLLLIRPVSACKNSKPFITLWLSDKHITLIMDLVKKAKKNH